MSFIYHLSRQGLKLKDMPDLIWYYLKKISTIPCNGCKDNPSFSKGQS